MLQYWPVDSCNTTNGYHQLLPSDKCILNTFKPTPEQGSVSSNLLYGPCPSTACAYIFVYVLQRRRLALGFGLRGNVQWTVLCLVLPSVDLFLHYFEKQRTVHNHVFAAWCVVYSDTVCSWCCRCVAWVESSFQKVKCPVFWMMCVLWKLWMNL